MAVPVPLVDFGPRKAKLLGELFDCLGAPTRILYESLFEHHFFDLGEPGLLQDLIAVLLCAHFRTNAFGRDGYHRGTTLLSAESLNCCSILRLEDARARRE